MTTAITNEIEKAREAMERVGVRAAAAIIIPDGKLRRFSTNSDPHDDSGWCIFFEDGLFAGCYGDWRTGIKQTYCAKGAQELTATEQAQYREMVEAARFQRETEESRRHAEAAERAQRIWNEARPATSTHVYLVRKGIKPHGTRIYRGLLVIGGLAMDGALIIPLLDTSGDLCSLEFIRPDGQKRFLPSGLKSGCFTEIGPIDESTKTVVIGEGFSTVGSVHEATDLPAVVAFDAGNLLAVAEAVHSKYPHARLIIAGDNDKSGVGQKAATEAAKAVDGLVAIPKTLGEDWNDMHQHEGLEAVRQALQESISSTTSGMSGSETGHAGETGESEDHSTSGMSASESEGWPQLDPAARHGLVGDIVALLEPHTEADPVALAVTTLSEYGCSIGPAPHIILDGGRHPLLFWPIVPGKSSKSRKGSSERRTGALFREADPDWTRGECRGTLSSGEGLVFAIRDASERNADPGVQDKRLFLVQSEFGSVLRVMHREGNSLSGVIRDAWDGQDLCPMTKNNLIRASRPHISIVGHITMDELKRNLAGTEMSNGFANRFAFFIVRRSKELPEASEPDCEQRVQIVRRLRQALTHGRTVSRLTMTEAARAAWRAIYSDLSADRPGIVGALLGRAEAQVQRIAALYALLDLKSQVDLEHLEAALALWQYAEASTMHLFGDSTGDSDADTILQALRQTGQLTDTDISALFGFNRSAGRLSHAKKILQTAGLAECFLQKKEGQGRRVTVWRLKRQ